MQGTLSSLLAEVHESGAIDVLWKDDSILQKDKKNVNLISYNKWGSGDQKHQSSVKVTLVLKWGGSLVAQICSA